MCRLMWLLCHLCKSLQDTPRVIIPEKSGLTFSALVTLLCWLRKKISPSKKLAFWNVSVQEVRLSCPKAWPPPDMHPNSYPVQTPLTRKAELSLQATPYPAKGRAPVVISFHCWNQQFNPSLTRAWISPSQAKALLRNDWISWGAIKQRASAESGTRLTGL